MFKHEFHALGDCGHKRNFTYYHGQKKDLKYIHEFCHLCDKKVKYTVLKYLEKVKEV